MTICPNCKKEYTPKLKRKDGELIQVTYPNATREEREQLISGLCSNKCWDNHLGIGTIESYNKSKNNLYKEMGIKKEQRLNAQESEVKK